MAVTRSANVIVSDATADSITDAGTICGIKIVAGGAAATASLTIGSVVVWEASQDASTDKFEQVKIKTGQQALTVALSGLGAKIIVYTE